jgi:hypothetical protein
VAEAASGYVHSGTVWISPRFLRWAPPVAVVALFVLMFLPWTGAFPGGYRVYSQNAWQTIWGGVSLGPVETEARAFVQPLSVGANHLMLLYALLVLVALGLVVAPLWLTPTRVEALPPIVRSLWPWRLWLGGAVAVGVFVLLMVQLWGGFGLETAVTAEVDGKLAGEFAAARVPMEHEKANIHRGLEVGAFSLHRTLWLHLAVLSHLLLIVSVGLELWLLHRGTRPLPRIDVQS